MFFYMARKYKYNPKSGDKFNRLTFIEELEPLMQKRKDRYDKMRRCLVRCDCGSVVDKLLNNVVQGKVKSCGCYTKERISTSAHNNKSLVVGVGVNDYEGLVIDNGKNIKSYAMWRRMLKRCYSANNIAQHPTYIGCTVCDEWKYFSNFKKWFDENYIDGYHLDKDILSSAIKIYSPTTCCYIPREINNLFKTETKGSSIAQGVYKKGDKYVAMIRIETKLNTLGRFSNVIDANNAYQVARMNYVQQKAKKFKNKIANNVYEALMNYKPKLM